MALLEATDLGISFGGLRAVDELNMQIEKGALVGLIGPNGAGKTKQLIELVHAAVESESGSVVCIEPSADMTYDISYNARLINASEYGIDSYACLRGFVSGLYAGNYDISHVFVDNLGKIAGSELKDVEEFLAWLDRFSEKNSVKFTVTISASEDMATEGLRHYL